MLKSEIEVGGVYEVRWHDGSFTHVEILGTRRENIQQRRYPYRVTGTKTRWTAKNLSTGRVVVIKSAAKMRRRIK